MSVSLSRRGLLSGAMASAALLLPAAAAKGGPSTGKAADQADVRARLRELELAYDGRIGAFALDTATGATIGYRAHERFPLCSTFKALAAAAVLRKSRRCDPGLLDQVIHWTQADVLPASPITAQHVDTGLTVAELCAAAIEYSDNTAGNLLLDQIGGPPGVTAFARSLGDPVSRLDRRETDLNIWSPDERRDTTSPAAIGRDLHALALGDALAPQDRERLVGWLKANTTGGARIRAGLPPTWIIGDKTGLSTSYGADNDIAVVWPMRPVGIGPSQRSQSPSAPPLVLAVYTNRNQPDAPADNAVLASTATILAGALGAL